MFFIYFPEISSNCRFWLEDLLIGCCENSASTFPASHRLHERMLAANCREGKLVACNVPQKESEMNSEDFFWIELKLKIARK